MGMYDTIRFAGTLPDDYVTDTEFQTKSLERDLVDYFVDEQGALWQFGHAGAAQPEGRTRDQYTGSVIFYDYTLPNTRANFRGRFVGGVLQSIERISEIEANADPARFAPETTRETE